MSSHRQIFKSSAIIGGASAINIAIGIAKVKILAVLLGPTGIGLMGLYTNIMNIVSTVAGCGLSNSGVRQIAATGGKADVLAGVRRALWLGSLVLGIAGMIGLWLLRGPVAIWIFDDSRYAHEVGWISLGVLFTLLAGSQTALLQGLRRIRDLALVNIIGALIAAIAGVLLVYWRGQSGVLWFVLVAPVVSVLVAGYYTARLPKLNRRKMHWRSVGIHSKAMIKLGIPIMLAGLLTLGTALATRSLVFRELGVDASGYFQAAWAISMTYISFVLGAMGMDYYPRLTEIIEDHGQACKLVSEQSEMALLLSGPVILTLITLAPWLIHLLYTEGFAPAAEVLRWQALGDILKVSSWPMGFVLLAKGRGGLFMITEFIWGLSYIGPIVVDVGDWGLVITGIAFWFAYLIYFLVMAIITARLIGYRPGSRNTLLLVILMIVGGLIVFCSDHSEIEGLIVGLIAVLFFGFYSLFRLNKLLDLRAWLKKKLVNRLRDDGVAK